MGAAMVRRLVLAGHQVTVWNRTQAAVDVLLGELGGSHALRSAESPALAVRGNEVVLTALADGDVTRAVLMDAEVLKQYSPRAVVVDVGTSGPTMARFLYAELKSVGVRFVDAPVSGSVPAVDAGTLLIMASGDDEDVHSALRVLGAFAGKVIHVGAAGTGQVMKLAVNLVVHDLNAAVSEALRLAEHSSVSREDAYSVLEASVVAAPFLTYKRAAFLDPSTPVAMSLGLAEKDLRLITSHALQAGERVPVTEEALRTVGGAVLAGMGARDMADLSRYPTSGVSTGPGVP